MTDIIVKYNTTTPKQITIDGKRYYIDKIPKKAARIVPEFYYARRHKINGSVTVIINRKKLMIKSVEGFLNGKSNGKLAIINNSKSAPRALFNSLAVKYLYQGVLHNADTSLHRFTKNKYFDPNLVPLIAKFLI